MTVTHESILKLISYRFGLGYLNKRHRYASNIGFSFDWHKPNLEIPNLPSPLPPITLPCALQKGGATADQQARAEQAEKEGPGIGSDEWNEYVDRLGYDVKPATPDEIFPDYPKAADRLRDLWGRE
jgi:hypothetical protein